MGKSLKISPTVQFIKEDKLAIETNIVPGCKHDGLHRSLDLFLESAADFYHFEFFTSAYPALAKAKHVSHLSITFSYLNYSFNFLSNCSHVSAFFVLVAKIEFKS